jgi:hypothetical protein
MICVESIKWTPKQIKSCKADDGIGSRGDHIFSAVSNGKVKVEIGHRRWQDCSKRYVIWSGGFDIISGAGVSRMEWRE